MNENKIIFKEFSNSEIYESDIVNIKFISNELSYKTEFFDYDFNMGFRIKFHDCNNKYRVLILDKNTRDVINDIYIKPEENVIYRTCKKYYIEYEIRVFKVNSFDIINPYPLKVIEFDVSEKDILILIAGDNSPAGLGDSIAWMSAAYQFKLLHPSINLYIHLAYPELEEVFKNKYSNLFNFIHYSEINNNSFYASYLCGCFFDDKRLDFCPIKYEKLSLIDQACHVLGFKFDDSKLLDVSIKEENENKPSPYVCLATHGSAIYKEWINFSCRDDIVCFLKDVLHYDVYSIDLKTTSKCGPLCETCISEYTIDSTGNIPLIERVKMISNADFFIGISSGLSWLAWICNVPVVLISGFTNPITEFKTPYRIINTYECNSCWNDESIKWDMSTTVCPRKDNNCFREDFLICSSSIKFYSVLSRIIQIPCVREKMEKLNDTWNKT